MTKLSPLEEVLFKSWAGANGIDNHDDPSNSFDHRGLFKQTNGLVMPHGTIRSIADNHNKAVEDAQAGAEGGDTTFPDPYAAQAEMHAANVDAETKRGSDQAKMQMEERKMAHASAEKQKDREHKLQMEQMKVQQKAQADEANRQARAQEAEQNRQATAQQAHVDRQIQVEQADKDRQAGVQDKVMSEHFARTRPQPVGQPGGTQANPQPQAGPAAGAIPSGGGPQPTPPQGRPDGLAQQLIQRY
jgi:hypothetical protein